ncbi:MAG: AAA family ATPase [Rhodospirillales bacterium]|nr:AAA family ATPase [Rhodospirillales bacterium]
MAAHWIEPGNKPASIQLSTATQRRLFDYLRISKVRDVKGLPQPFIDEIAAAYVAAGDPAAANVQQTVNPSASGPWKIRALKIEGFGGVNLWNGKPFELEVDRESLLMEGPNGSGKSSLTAAIIWALTGERPRDHGDSSLDAMKPFLTRRTSTQGHGRRSPHIPPISPR